MGFDNIYKGLLVPDGHASIFYAMDEDKRLSDLCKDSIAVQSERKMLEQAKISKEQELTQKLEFTLKQLEKTQVANIQLQQQLLAQNDTILAQNDTISKFQATLGSLLTQLKDTATKVFENHNKYLKEKHKVDLVKVKLDDFINTHGNINDQDQLLEILGDLQQEEA